MNKLYNGNNRPKNYKKMTKNELALHTISAELKKTSNILRNNYIIHKSNKFNKYYESKDFNIKLSNLSNNNTNNNTNNSIGKNSIFKDIKYYDAVKPPYSIKKNKKIKKSLNNNIPCVSFTEINYNLKKTFSTHFNTNNIINKEKKNSLQKSSFNNTNKVENSNSFNSLSKSKNKNNSNLLSPLQNYIHSRNKSANFKLIKTNLGVAKSFNGSLKKNSNDNHYLNNHFINTNNFISINSPTFGPQKNNNLLENIPKIVEDEKLKIKIQKLMGEIEKKDEELKNQKLKIKEYEKKISEFQKINEKMDTEMKTVKKNYAELQIKYDELFTENNDLKEKLKENEDNLNFLKEKETTLMKVLYIIKENGIDINSILNEINNEDNNKDSNENNSETNRSSNLTVYFPDKVHMKNTMETKGAEKIPNLDFNQIPEYSFRSEKENQNDENDDYDFKKFNKVYQNSA